MFFRKFIGFLAALLGLAGVVGSVVVIVAVWPFSKQLTQDALEIADNVQPALVKVDKKLGLADDYLGIIQGHVRDLRSAAQKVSAKGADANPDDKARLESIVSRVADTLARTEDQVDNIRAGLSAAQSIAKLTNSMQVTSSDATSPLLDNIDEIASLLQKVSVPLHEINEHVKNVKLDRDLRVAATEIARLTTEIDTRLTPLGERVQRGKGQVEDINSDITEIRKTINRWSDLAPLLVTILFIWIAIAQLSLLIHGWSMIRARPDIQS